MTSATDMKKWSSRAASTAIGATIAAIGLAGIARPASAADIEVFFIPPDDMPKPAVLFIVDTSSSMFSQTTTEFAPFDPSATYSGSCDTDKFYWVKGSNSPSCEQNELSASNFRCNALRVRVEADGLATPGIQIAREVKTGKNYAYVKLPADQATNKSDAPVYCEGGGGTVQSGSPAPSGSLSFSPAGTFDSDYTFYTGNYLNYRANPPAAGGGDGRARIDVMLETLVNTLAKTDNIKAGLMRLDSDGQMASVFDNQCALTAETVEGTQAGNGGMVVFPVTDIDQEGVIDEMRFETGIDLPNWNGVKTSGDPLQQDGRFVQSNNNSCYARLFTPAGRAPLAGAFAEAWRYFEGAQPGPGGAQGNVDSQHPYNSVRSSLASRAGAGEYDESDPNDHCTSNNIAQCWYRSPLEPTACALPKGYIILLTDGTTEQEGNSDASIQQLIGRKCDENAADDAIKSVTRSGGYSGEDALESPSMCVNDLARFLEAASVKTYTIGFQTGNGPAADAARTLLEDTASYLDDNATKGFYVADTEEELELAITSALREVFVDSASFTSPAVTVNAFNRTQNLNELYMSLFRPSSSYRWRGNIKKYEINPSTGEIVGRPISATQLGDPVVDDDGTFRSDAKSFWHTGIDGKSVTSGGAATQLDDWGDRTIYTDLKSNNLSSGINDLDDVILEADADTRTGLQPTDEFTAQDLIEWAYGRDVGDFTRPATDDAPAAGDEGPNENDLESRFDMGDPLHAKPLTIVYGGEVTNPNPNDAVVYAVTNDGFLHAIDAKTGAELWAFVPTKMVKRLRDRYINAGNWTTRGYGLDGSIREIRIDRNLNGIIEASEGDRVILYFGERRGGQDYYAVEVTNRQQPVLLWQIGPTQLPGIGQTWSTPQPARIRIGNETNPRIVLIFGGGYNPSHDSAGYVEDTTGNGIYMVDALTGSLLWRARPDCSAGTACLDLDEMKFAIPSDIRVLDLNGDTLADRMYAADLGGRVWRFDIFNGNSASGGTQDLTNNTTTRLVEGGILASLGAAEDGSPLQADVRRFFYAPDPALVTYGARTFINIAIGSGHREMPVTDRDTQNALFSVRDYNVFRPLLSGQYKQDCTGISGTCQQWVTESDDDLVDLTNIADSSAVVGFDKQGWKIWLNSGEKVLSETRTFEGAIFATTYQPKINDVCTFGQARLYVARALDARPVQVLQNDKPLGNDPTDRVTLLDQQTIPPEVVFIFPSPSNPTGCVGPNCRPRPICLVGLEGCGSGFNNAPVRTFWRERGAD